MSGLAEQDRNALKTLIKQMIAKKNNIDKIKEGIKDIKNKKSGLESMIIEKMEELNLTVCKYKDKTTGNFTEILLETKLKKKTLKKSDIKNNCIEYCDGDVEKAEELLGYLYDKDARGHKEKTKIEMKINN